jgi:hypothetical protein
MSGPLTISKKNPVPRVCAAIVVLGGTVGLLGWTARLPLLYRFTSQIPAMLPWTAVCVTAVGVALLGRNWRNEIAKNSITVIGSITTLVVMGFILLEYVSGTELGIDHRLFPQEVQMLSMHYPGRPAPQTALGFFLLALALLGSLRVKRGRKFDLWIEALTLFSAGIALMAFFGYAYSLDALFSVPHLKGIGMSPYTAAYLLLACVGALLVEPSSWTVKILRRSTAGGELARLLLPLFIFVPMGLGFLRIEAERAGWINHEIGTSLMALFQVFIGVGMLFWLVYTIDRAKTLEKFVTMSCVSKRILHDGEWIAIEQYLYDQYHIQISHGMTPKEAEDWLSDAQDYLAQEKGVAKTAPSAG